MSRYRVTRKSHVIGPFVIGVIRKKCVYHVSGRIVYRICEFRRVLRSEFNVHGITSTDGEMFASHTPSPALGNSRNPGI